MMAYLRGSIVGCFIAALIEVAGNSWRPVSVWALVGLILWRIAEDLPWLVARAQGEA